MRKYLANAFSLQMIAGFPAVPVIEEISKEEIPTDVMSVVGHADTASVLSEEVGFSVPFNRESIKINVGDELYVAQVVGGRLPEGATVLPEGFNMVYLKIHLVKPTVFPSLDGKKRVCDFVTCCRCDCTMLG